MTDKQPDKNNKPSCESTMGDDPAKTINAGKRRVVATLLGVGGVAGATQWSKPVITAVVLPAHAATSAPRTTGGGRPRVTTTPPPPTTLGPDDVN